MYWFYLVIAGLFETLWAITLKLSEGFSRPFPSLITLIGMIASFLFLAKALKSIPAYSHQKSTENNIFILAVNAEISPPPILKRAPPGAPKNAPRFNESRGI